MVDLDRRLSGLTKIFTARLGTAPDILVYSPGRVNLIGEHTDYNDGWVLPAALDMGTDLAARRRPDRVLHTVALRLDEEDWAPLDDLRLTEGPEWSRFVRGTAALLPDLGIEPPGVDLVIAGDLPLRSGLASSASLEMAVAAALVWLAGATVESRELSRLGQRVENEIIGVQSGIMDQLVITSGVDGAALLIDCRSLELEPVALPGDVQIVVLDSAVPRTLAASAYNQRRAECTRALAALRVTDPSLRALRDVDPQSLEQLGSRLSPVEWRRVRHVVSENQRVQGAVSSLRRGDLDEVGRLMLASHQSLRDDYEVSGPELDTLVTTAIDTPGVVGARLTGAGFGGCVVALVKVEHAEEAAVSIMGHYKATTGKEGQSFLCLPSRGTWVVEP